MKASDLLPGQVFTVEKPDPEYHERVCLTNDAESGIRWGWPNNSQYWCSMGAECEVRVVARIEYQVHTGTPSWHQRRAGAISSGVGIYASRREAEIYVNNYRKHHPDSPCFIREVRRDK